MPNAPEARPDKRARPAPEPGSVVGGRYRIVGTLGEGGMGVVLEAEHLELGTRVALKLLDSVHSQKPAYAERFKREARITSRMGHPHIVGVVDLGVAEDGRLFYAMELVKGEHLGDVLARDGAFDQSRAARVLLQLSDALGAAHEQAVVHRDLKPENILVTEDAEGRDFVRLVDFGIALTLDTSNIRLTRQGEVVGTPHYMAPEQVAGKPVDARTDVYAAGAVAYELLTGTPPFFEGVSMEIMAAHIHSTPDPPRQRAPHMEIHPLLEGVVLRALEKAPEDRQQSMEELALEIWAAMEVIQPREKRVAKPVAPVAKTRPKGHDTIPDGAPPLWAKLGLSSVPRGLAIFVVVVFVVLFGAIAGLVAVLLADGPEPQVGSSVAGAAVDPAPPGKAPTPPSAKKNTPVRGATASGSPALTSGHAAIADAAAADGAAEPIGEQRRQKQAADTSEPPPRERPQAKKLISQAQATLRSGDTAGATTLFQQAVRRAPGNAAAHAGLGQAEFQRGNNQAAARHYGRAVELSPSNVRYRLLLAQVLLRLGRRGQARGECEEALRLDPDNALARRMLERL